MSRCEHLEQAHGLAILIPVKELAVLFRRRVITWSVIAAALVGGALPNPADAQCEYEVTIIQAPDCPPFGPQATIGTGINALGHVVGYHCQCICGSNSAFVWTPESGLVTLDPPPGVYSAIATDINDAGQIVGMMSVSGVGDRGFVWQDSQWIELSPEGQGIHASAYAINDAAQVVGYRDHDDGVTYRRYAFLCQDGVFADILPTQDGTAIARDVNQSRQVTGHMSWGPDWNEHAFLWGDGVTSDLGPIPSGFTSSGLAINNLGQIVGWGRVPTKEFPSGATRPFFWYNGQMIDLGTQPGFELSAASDINDAGQVVGRSWYSGGNPNISRAFIWQNGAMTDLNDLLVSEDALVMTSAAAINNSGQVAGTADIGGAGGQVVAVLLTPVAFPVGDLNVNCTVNAADLALLLASWGSCSRCSADLNLDETVNTLDLVILLNNWG